MISPAYVRTMAAYNAEMNRRLYGAAARLSDAERRQPRGAFWGSIHGTLNHLLWGDQQWMSRFDNWPKPDVAIKQSAGLIDDFAALSATREKADADISRWAAKVDEPGWPRTWCGSAAPPGARCAPQGTAGDPFLQSPDPPSRAGACDADRRRAGDRRHRPVPADPADRGLAPASTPREPPPFSDARAARSPVSS